MSEQKFSIKNYIAIIAVLLVLVMTVLDVTLVNVALPVLATELHVSDSLTVWIVTIYQLVITMLLLPLSSVGDLYSYRRNFLIGVVIFTVASVLCAMSQSFRMIIVSRAMQGIGAAFVMSVNVALTRTIYPADILGRGLALNAMVIAVATAAGPTLAGAILSVATWHWLFLINVPFGIAAFFIGKRYLPHNPVRSHKEKYDWISAIENVIVFGLIFYSLGNLTRKGDLLTNLCLLVIGIVVGFFYVRRQLHHEVPMLPVDLFKIRLYSLSIGTSMCSFIAQNLVMISLPFLFLNGFKFSEITTGLLMTPLPLATMIISPVTAKFIERHNPGITASVGMLVYGIGIFLLATLTDTNATIINIVWRMTICGIGFGIFQTPNNVVMISATPVERTGGAGGMQSTSRLVGQTLGATFVTLIFAVSLPSVSVQICLYLGIGMALLAGIFSISRVSRNKRANTA